MTVTNSKAKAMGAFLKSRRERLSPEDAGLEFASGQRKTPGLRREEVSLLAGVSVTYYTWLEQGRDLTPSKDVIDSIAEALQLSPAEKSHLYQLWNPHAFETPFAGPAVVDPHMQKIIDQLTYPLTSLMREAKCSLGTRQLRRRLPTLLPFLSKIVISCVCCSKIRKCAIAS